MLAETLARVDDGDIFEKPLAIGSLRHKKLLEIEAASADLLLEPVGRNSAPAIVAACLESRPDAFLIVLPADHHIIDVAAFKRAIVTGLEVAKTGRIVTFGIDPDFPATGYGYIEATEGEKAEVRSVERFVEKPDVATAARYLATGRFFWNAGIFLFRADTMLEAFRDYAPDILEGVTGALKDGELDRTAFEQVRSESIDYAVLEAATNISVIPVSMGWSDVGDYRALHSVLSRNDDMITTIGPAVVFGSRSVYVRSSGPTVVVNGLEDVAVVATDNEVLVTRLSEAPGIKPAVIAAERMPLDVVTGDQRRWLSDWLWNQVMPHWAERAVDPTSGRFIEALGLDGKPLAIPTRGRIAPRQLYSFAVAKQLGWNPDGAADKVIEAAIAFLDGPGRAPSGGWAHRISPDGAIEDPRRDLYDHAFVALAASQLILIGEPAGHRFAEEAFKTIDFLFADSKHGGWHDPETAPDVKLANPHMHLLEASLAHYAATADPATAKRMERIASFFEKYMFDPETGAMMETFSSDWGRRPSRVEPGHCYEWAFLLDALRRTTGRDTLSWCRRLVEWSERHGLDGGLAVDSFDETPETFRLWPQLERIRALSWLPRLGSPVELGIERVMALYLSAGPRSGWVDQLGADGQPLSKTMPASMLYHFMTALAPLAGPPQ